jgi:2-keto-4-pentenoate hydratase/2-oxohepta-3-ene-1,7-dioic acid hydratase in catechol pathway
MKLSLPNGRQLTPGKLLCIGRNYAKHAAEMKSDVPDRPMVFLKPSTALIRTGDAVRIPQASSEVHHEGELVAVIGSGGKHIAAEDALDHVAGYAIGLDMTARDIQAGAKERRHPWSVAKGFDTFAPLGPIVPASEVADPQQLTLGVSVNGETRQHGSTKHMIFSVAELIAYCSSVFTLEPGDLLYTGTPEGVGPVEAGDVLEATFSAGPGLSVRVEKEQV